MKHLLITIAALVLVGCGESRPPEPPTVAPYISIHDAADNGNIEAIKQHIAAGTDVNATSDIILTPLTYAAFKGHKEVAELLITAGADMNPKRYSTPPLHGAADHGQKEIVELLIAKGADVNAKDVHVETPLLFASRRGHKEVSELLIANGADVNAKDGREYSSLHWAAREGHKEIAELLLAEGADVNIANRIGHTALDMAEYLPEIADLLRKHGAKTGEELDTAGN